MTTEAKTLTWQEAYDLIESWPLDSLVQRARGKGDKNCVLAVLALHLGYNLDNEVLINVSNALGEPWPLVNRLMHTFDNANTVALGKERALTYIQEQIDALARATLDHEDQA